MKLHIENPGDRTVGIQGWWATVELDFEPEPDEIAGIKKILADAFTKIADFQVYVFTDSDFERMSS